MFLLHHLIYRGVPPNLICNTTQILPKFGFHFTTRLFMTRLFFTTLLIAFVSQSAIAQSFGLLTPLSAQVSESSGLIYLQERLITHNDSGDDPVLYEIDSLTGNVLREVEIQNAQHIDWEDICHDDTYIYIGDIGNNNGSRTDLKIYRITIDDYFNEDLAQVPAEIISFHYADQTQFGYEPFTTPYDAEAMIALGDSLYIFTKNWANLSSEVYPVPKTPGNYTLYKVDSLDVGGWVSGADICSETGRILLTAYTIFQPLVVSISNYEQYSFSEGEVEMIFLQMPTGYSHQIESVTCIHPHLFYITSEENALGSSGLFKLDFNPLYVPRSEEIDSVIYPNPASEVIHISHPEAKEIHFYDHLGKKVKSEKSKTIDVSDLMEGSYVVEICDLKNRVLAKQKLIIAR